ncbi:phage/plasmid primase, P4 family [Pirellulimonas nuda]|uniref:phage/plasmid primase, P4 family n=1 Tax=Pirellulimonas nuda TaxID=2528009 RepID=UPI0018D28EFB|nr:phage/plasmid primase, P4 family [Pirellulimonas nuda]
MTAFASERDRAAAEDRQPNRQLLPMHREELKKSGITAEAIFSAGVYTEHDTKQIAALLNRKSFPLSHSPAIVYPFLDAAGRPVLHRVKPIKLVGGAKYLQPSKTAVRAYVPPSVWPMLADPKVPLLITEGEKKALSAACAGFACVGLVGVEAWHKKGSSKLVPELEHVAWEGRDAFVVFDSDAASNPNVQRPERGLAGALLAHNAKARIVRLPSGEGGAKVGLDDFLVAHGSEALQELLDNAVPLSQADLGQAAGDESTGKTGKKDHRQAMKEFDAHDESINIIERCFTTDGAWNLYFWNGCWWRWSNGCYHATPQNELDARLYGFMNREFIGVRIAHVRELREQMRSKLLIESAMEQPEWLGQPPFECDPRDLVAMQDCAIYLPNLFVTGAEYRIPATPRLFTTSACDFKFEPSRPEPKCWLKFLESVFPDDPQSIDTLQEIFGYLLTPDTSQQKAFLIIGPTRSGKGTIARLLQKLIGTRNCCGPTLSSLTQPFGLQPLMNKSLAIISDARLNGRADQSVVLERILSISGEDSLTVDIKHLAPVTTKLPTRLLLMTNELPKVADASSAFVGRFIVLTMTQSFLGKEDRGLDQKLAEELPCIWWWAAAGWMRLRERGHFQQPDSSLETLRDLRDLTSAVGAFVREQCEMGVGYSIDIKDLFAAWRSWCGEQGRDHPGTRQSFGRDLNACSSLIRRKERRVGRSKVGYYEGIRLSC